MLQVVIQGEELFDEETNEFSSVGDTTIELEHSLVSLSKWEAKYKKPFLSTSDKTAEETVSYFWFMLITPGVDSQILSKLSQHNLDAIQKYIQSTESATTFGKMPERPGTGEVITAELIYYWLVAFNIPFEVETWHINRLFALIRICNIKNQKPKKMSRSEIAQRNRELNEQRRQQLNTNG